MWASKPLNRSGLPLQRAKLRQPLKVAPIGGNHCNPLARSAGCNQCVIHQACLSDFLESMFFAQLRECFSGPRPVAAIRRQYSPRKLKIMFKLGQEPRSRPIRSGVEFLQDHRTEP